jgi:hypothetical protein
MPPHAHRPVPPRPGRIQVFSSRYLAARRRSRQVTRSSRHIPDALSRLPRAARPDVVGSKRVRTKAQGQEAAMTSGFVLLILIGVLVAYAYTRLRGKMKLSVSGKNWIAPIVIVVIVAIMLWASHSGH